jgi:hypothetical protein
MSEGRNLRELAEFYGTENPQKNEMFKSQVIFWDATQCCKNRRFGEAYCLYHQSERNQLTRNKVNSN